MLLIAVLWFDWKYFRFVKIEKLKVFVGALLALRRLDSCRKTTKVLNLSGIHMDNGL